MRAETASEQKAERDMREELRALRAIVIALKAMTWEHDRAKVLVAAAVILGIPIATLQPK